MPPGVSCFFVLQKLARPRGLAWALPNDLARGSGAALLVSDCHQVASTSLPRLLAVAASSAQSAIASRVHFAVCHPLTTGPEVCLTSSQS